jgi:hypothetical protein
VAVVSSSNFSVDCGYSFPLLQHTTACQVVLKRTGVNAGNMLASASMMDLVLICLSPNAACLDSEVQNVPVRRDVARGDRYMGMPDLVGLES